LLSLVVREDQLAADLLRVAVLVSELLGQAIVLVLE